MNKVRVQDADARRTIRDLQKDLSTLKSSEREIKVSFRGQDGAVGRRDFATHWIHWYPAKMFHQIPSVFLDNLELPTQSTILDPFCGSGTVLLEANLRGHQAIGIDVNPLARLISQVKTTPIEPSDLRSELALLVPSAKRSRSLPVPQLTLDSWLSPPARIGLHRLSTAIARISDAKVRAFFQVTLTSIVRRVSLADPAIPPLVRLREDRGETAGARYRNALRRSRDIKTSSVYSTFADTAATNVRRMSELHALRHQLGRTQFSEPRADAAHSALPSGSVDAIITSPPYCGSQKYVRSMKLELILTGCSQAELRQLDRQMLGTEAVTTRVSKLNDLLTGVSHVDHIVRMIHESNPVRARMASDYSKYLSSFAEECRRVLRPGGQLLVTLGRSTLAGVGFPADRIFRRAGEAVGLESLAVLVDPIRSRGLLTQRHRTSGRIDHEYIVWMRRPPLDTPR